MVVLKGQLARVGKMLQRAAAAFAKHMTGRFHAHRGGLCNFLQFADSIIFFERDHLGTNRFAGKRPVHKYGNAFVVPDALAICADVIDHKGNKIILFHKKYYTKIKRNMI